MPKANSSNRSPKAIGDVSEALVLARLVQLGYSVSIPFGDNQRYDMIVDDHQGELVRAQVKTGRLKHGCVNFPTATGDDKRRGYVGEADAFLVYCPDTNEIYRVPVAECGTTGTVLLRVEPYRYKGVHPNVRWAVDYVFEQAAIESPLRTCAELHPDRPPKIRETTAATGKGGKRRYCQECNRVWGKQSRDRLAGKTA